VSQATDRAVRPAAGIEIRPQLHYIAGEFQPGVDGRTFETLDPTTNEPLAEVAEGLAADVDLAVKAARRAFDEGPWPRLRPSERAAVLRRIATAIRDAAGELIPLEILDIGMPVAQMRGLAARAAENFDYFAGVVPELAGEAYQVGGEFINYTIYKPVGVAGLIMPWNAPLMLSTWRIAPCLAAGNTIVLKPAEWSPLTTTRLAELLDDAGLPEGVFNVVHGFGETAGAALVAHEGVDLISFTGESATGSAIMANGAATLKRFSFELGGKSPVVVFADADFERAVDAVVAQIFTLNGQRCTAGSRLLVEDPMYEDLVQAVAARARNIRVGDPFDETTELGPLIRPEHLERVLGFLDSAREEGARLLAGGRRPAGLERGNFLEATVFADVSPSMRIFQEEVFGPVLVATPFTDEDDAIRLANATEYGLAAYVWTQDVSRAHRVAQAIDSGLVWINSQNVRDLRTPFGGMKASGIGREGGHYSFEFYCELQTVHVSMGSHRIPRLGLEAPEERDG
jgi:5-carboxymethyl-2-hydroxymuconic-semialdehyde dehydrogenase